MMCKDRNASAQKAIMIVKSSIDKAVPEHTIPDVFFDEPLALFESCFGASSYRTSKAGGSFKQISIEFVSSVARFFPQMATEYYEVFDVKVPA